MPSRDSNSGLPYSMPAELRCTLPDFYCLIEIILHSICSVKATCDIQCIFVLRVHILCAYTQLNHGIAEHTPGVSMLMLRMRKKPYAHTEPACNTWHMFQSQMELERPKTTVTRNLMLACAPLTVVLAAPTVFKRYHSPLYGFSCYILNQKTGTTVYVKLQ